MKQIIFLILCVFLMFSCGPRQESKTIYLVRHAEKMLDSEDPLLSVAGTVRSQKLADILKEEQISHIFSTNTIRTKATAQPLADQIQIPIEIYDAHHHDDIIGKLRSLKGNVLVIGHSNTVHHLANYFVGDETPYLELGDIEYDFIFVVELKADGTSKVLRKIYKEF